MNTELLEKLVSADYVELTAARLQGRVSSVNPVLEMFVVDDESHGATTVKFGQVDLTRDRITTRL